MGISPAVCGTILPRRKLGAFLLLMVLWVLACPTIATMPAQAGDYRLNSGDVLTFDFLDDAEVPVTATVSGAGAAQFPLIGAVEVVGLTVPEALSGFVVSTAGATFSSIRKSPSKFRPFGRFSFSEKSRRPARFPSTVG